MARPISVWTPKYLEELNGMIEEYTEKTAIPIFAEFCYLNNLDRPEMYKHQELSHAIKKMMLKKEAHLEKMALSGKASTPMCIFSLKQLGWSDKRELSVNVDNEAYDKLKGLYEKGDRGENKG